jgi:hypothetical protein
MNKVVKTLIWVGIGIIIGALLFSKCGSTPVAPEIVLVKKIVADLQKETKPLQKKIDSLVNTNNQLKEKSVTVAQQLQKEKSSRKMAEHALNEVISTEPEPVVQYIADYIEHSNAADSLCTALAAIKDRQLIIKDSIVTAKDSLYSKLNNSFQFSLNQSQLLLDYNKNLKKDIRKRRAGNFVWKAATVAAFVLLIKK